MSLAEARRIFTPAFLNQIHTILINGNLGDFVAAKDGLEIVKYFKSQNPKLNIQISTNASARPNIWAELAQLGATVYFCLDGLKGTHELYRTQTDWDTVINNAKSFIQAGGNAVWKMILFDHNKDQVEQCKHLSTELGFTKFQLVDHGRNDFPVYNQQQQFTHHIGSNTRRIDFVQLHKEYQDSPVDQIIDVTPTQITCQSKEKNSVYISATGEVYPCCWMGFYPRQMKHYSNPQILPILPNNNNANDIGIEASIKWFDLVEKSWAGDQLYVCNTYCGVK